jgi:hypothetical protein
MDVIFESFTIMQSGYHDRRTAKPVEGHLASPERACLHVDTPQIMCNSRTLAAVERALLPIVSRRVDGQTRTLVGSTR